jgi:hypothetical protein
MKDNVAVRTYVVGEQQICIRAVADIMAILPDIVTEIRTEIEVGWSILRYQHQIRKYIKPHRP